MIDETRRILRQVRAEDEGIQGTEGCGGGMEGSFVWARLQLNCGTNKVHAECCRDLKTQFLPSETVGWQAAFVV